MPFVDVRDLQMYYGIHGKGIPLFTISGTGGDLRHSPIIFEMPVAKHFEILAPAAWLEMFEGDTSLSSKTPEPSIVLSRFCERSSKIDPDKDMPMSDGLCSFLLTFPLPPLIDNWKRLWHKTTMSDRL